MTLAQSLVLYFGALVVLCVVLCAAEDIGRWFDRDRSDYR